MRSIIAMSSSLCFTALLCSPSKAQIADFGKFQIKPSEVTLPAEAELGSYRRIIWPFENWDLICDENLVAMTKICNVTQTVIDADKQAKFGWSLASTEDGAPMMILRVQSGAGTDRPILLSFPGHERPTTPLTKACDATVCTAYLPVGPIMRQQISDGSVVGVNYETSSGEQVNLQAPLAGLLEALSAIE